MLPVTLPESFLLDSRFHRTQVNSDNHSWQKPTSSQKWWFSILLGFLFAILVSSMLFEISHSLTTKIGFSTMNGRGATVWGLLLHTVLYILIVRLILW